MRLGACGVVLTEGGHDVASVRDWPSDPGDDEVLDRAFRERRILVTLDKDFGDLAVAQGRPHCGIIRLVCLAGRDQPPAVNRVLIRYGDRLLAGAISTVDPSRTRIRDTQTREE